MMIEVRDRKTTSRFRIERATLRRDCAPRFFFFFFSLVHALSYFLRIGIDKTLGFAFARDKGGLPLANRIGEDSSIRRQLT